ncbi:patatin-like phospholipase family protein [Aestuariivirga sp.]|uniref:patatin-like phospholipase family protein n=1 Tax=Aestuariivirga sp. TaxID=2650926 RepID=UPI0039E23984
MTTPRRIGLALGGGGARGLAHIALLEAFDEMNLTPAVIAGCSMGALVGACYAAGMPAKELRLHAEKLLSNRVDFARYVFGARKTKPLELLSLGGLASMHLDGERLADLALPDTLPRNIEETRIPLKIIACDYERMEEAVLTTGPLAKAVGASIAIPGLISAPTIDGRVHVDGGVVNPVPFDHVRDGVDLVVAIDVTGKPRPAKSSKPGNMEIAVGSLLIMFNRMAQLKRALSPPDVYITPRVEDFGSADFFRARDIIAAAEPSKDELKRKLERMLIAETAEPVQLTHTQAEDKRES